MTREVSRFGHAAKVWLVIFGLGYLMLFLTGPDRWDEGWTGFIGGLALWTFLGAAQLWITLSQRVWYDDREVCSHILGKGRKCIRFADIRSVTASHSWKRAANRRPVSELQIEARDGRQMLISLRHLSLRDLQEMIDEIGQRTGLTVPDLRRFVR